MDLIIYVRQDIPCCAWRYVVVRCPRYVLGSARRSPWSSVLHRVHGGPCAPGCQVRRLFTHTPTTLPSRRNGVIRRSTRALRPWHRPLDVRQQIELKLNTDKTDLLFASSGHCCAALKGSYPVLKQVLILPSPAATFVCSARTFLWIWASIAMSLVSARAAFTDCENLRRIWRSLDSDSLATLIYTVVNSEWITIRYDTIRDAILTCARKPT